MGENNNNGSCGSDGSADLIKSELLRTISPVAAVTVDRQIASVTSAAPPCHSSSPASLASVSPQSAAVFSSHLNGLQLAASTQPALSPSLPPPPPPPPSLPPTSTTLQQSPTHGSHVPPPTSANPSANLTAGEHHSPPVMHMSNSADYLAQLLKDQKQVSAFPGVFFHLDRLLNEGNASASPLTKHDLITAHFVRPLSPLPRLHCLSCLFACRDAQMYALLGRA